MTYTPPMTGNECVNLDAPGWQTVLYSDAAGERYKRWLDSVSVHCAGCDTVLLTEDGPLLQEQMAKGSHPLYCDDCREDGGQTVAN